MLLKTTYDDIEQVLELYRQAVIYFKEKNIDQWQNNYPNKQSLMNDIQNGVSFVFKQNGIVLGSLACIPTKDVDYDQIYEGSWLNDENYLTIHRIVVDRAYKGRGIAQKMMQGAMNYAKSMNIVNVRIDTHQDNKAMLRFLEKEAFIYCGIVFIHGVHKRMAFQRKLTD